MYEIFKEYKHDLKTATEKLKPFGVTEKKELMFTFFITAIN